ncbi:MAG: NTP transferase domain-containing protein [Sedimentisphaerales bacterium]|nr:NTP transferase domain-containing protein [Sedimentisphaerales bacterium]
MIRRLENNIAAVVLAGGNASRLGHIPKGKLKLSCGTSMIQRLIDQLITAGIDDIAISTNNIEEYSVFGRTIVPDNRRGVGPLAGIEAGLGVFPDFDAVVFIPCDLPAITHHEISVLVDCFSSELVPVAYVQTGELFYHPLCTIVRSDISESVSLAIDNGTRRPLHLWQQLNGKPLKFPSEEPFFNINSFTDLEQWLALDLKAKL